MPQWRHPHPVDLGRRLSRIIHRDQGVIITAVLFREGGGSDVSGERSDVPWTDAEGVLHGMRLAGIRGRARYR